MNPYYLAYNLLSLRYMGANTDKKEQLVADKVNSILLILLEELNAEKEAVKSYREIHFQKVINFRGKIFTSAAAIATLLTAILALKSNGLVNGTVAQIVSQYDLMLLIGLDLVIVALAEFWFVQHISRTRVSWFQLEYKYVSAIAYLNNLRIFLSTIALEIGTVKVDQLYSLIPYTKISLAKYRIEIVDKIEEVSKRIIFADDIKEILKHPCTRQKELLDKA